MSNERCLTCKKPFRRKSKASLTAWIFQDSVCQCKSAAVNFVENVNALVHLVADNLESSSEPRTVSEETKESGALEVTSIEDQLIDDRYQIISAIGEGGMGKVFKVEDKVTKGVFAIKVLRQEFVANPATVRRFVKEAEAVGSLTHVNLIAVYGHGVTKSGSPYLVMDYIDGESLAQKLEREGSLESEGFWEFLLQVCEAVKHAHQKGVIHRDIKPSNIMILRSDETGACVKLVDFGIAKFLPRMSSDASKITGTGDVFGSPLYMSPEQCRGELLDVRSDIYSLGCVMYEVLTGKSPFAAENPVQVILKHLSETRPASIFEAAPARDVDPKLETVIFRCLELDPRRRYQSVAALVDDLLAIRERKSLGRSTYAPIFSFTSRDLLVATAAGLCFSVFLRLSNSANGEAGIGMLGITFVLMVLFYLKKAVETRLSPNFAPASWFLKFPFTVAMAALLVISGSLLAVCFRMSFAWFSCLFQTGLAFMAVALVLVLLYSFFFFEQLTDPKFGVARNVAKRFSTISQRHLFLAFCQCTVVCGCVMLLALAFAKSFADLTIFGAILVVLIFAIVINFIVHASSRIRTNRSLTASKALETGKDDN